MSGMGDAKPHGAAKRAKRWSRGSDPRLLRLTLDRLPDHPFGERPRGSKAPPCLKARLDDCNSFVLVCHLDWRAENVSAGI
jgi:hypothetical protein